jgi:hypothetical protein
MPCSHGGGDDERNRLSKRDFLKAAVAIGGASSVAAASVYTSNSPRKPRQYDPEVFRRTEQAQRQHAWEPFLSPPDSNAGGLPEHHVLLHLEYANEGTPTDEERERVEETFRTLEEAYEWSRLGLLFTASYSQKYFDRFDEDLPDDIDLRYPQEVIDAVDIEQDVAVVAESDDVHIHLTSDHPQAVLKAEQMVRGTADTANGVDVTTDISDVFEVVDRRTGFTDMRSGGLRKSGYEISKPHHKFGEDVPGENPVPEDAPVFFGFKSLFSDSQPHEDHVTITDSDNPFSGGTTMQVSLIKDDIKGWYDDHDHQDQVNRMYSPHHKSEETGPHGRDLSPASGTEETPMISLAEKVESDSEKGVVGHAQKVARSRDPLPPVMRRDFPSTHENHPHLQFVSLQKATGDFVKMRKHMSFIDPDGDEDAADELPLEDHGILNYIDVVSRGMYLLPPRRHRALPRPQPVE